MNQITPILTMLTVVSAGLIIIVEDDRLRISLLGLQYVCVTLLAGLSIPFQIALIKIISGTSVILILFMTAKQRARQQALDAGGLLPTGRAFRMIAVLLVSAAALGIGRSGLFANSSLDAAVIVSALMLGVLGLLQLGLLSNPLEIAVGLVTLLNGFEILYFPLERSLAVFGLLAAVHVGIALSISIVVLDIDRAAKG